jgi:aminoglycoside phosphotransferase (APT) family kinase protein
MIMEKIAAKNASHFLNDEISAQVIIDQMAESLVMVHKLDPKCIQNSKVLQEQQELGQQQLLKVMFFIKKGFFVFSRPRQRRFIAAVKRLEEVKPKKFCPAILHGDYHPFHFLVSKGRPVIVDWGMASVGDPAIDVGWTYHILRTEYEMVKVDLGEYFVKCYEKHRGQRLDNLQFGKDIAVFNLASWYGMLPFNSSTFGIFLSFVDHTFGNVYGKLRGSIQVQRARALMVARNQPRIWSNIKYIQSYVTQYLERGRYGKTN